MCQAPALRKRKQKALRLRGRRVRSWNVTLKNRGCVRWAVRNNVRKDEDRQADPQDKWGGGALTDGVSPLRSRAQRLAWDGLGLCKRENTEAFLPEPHGRPKPRSLPVVTQPQPFSAPQAIQLLLVVSSNPGQ